MQKKASLLALIPILYFTVSGGPFGIEEIVSAVGPFYSLLLILIIPIIWCIPEALIVGELTNLHPVQGGYYKWVQKAMGNFWGFMEGWWSILYTLVDLALYPTLVVLYLKILFPNLNFWAEYLIELSVIWFCVIINIYGIRTVGKILSVFKYFILILFVIFVVAGMKFLHGDFSYALHIPKELKLTSVVYGLSIVFWNYIGFDNATTVLGEIENPKKNYLIGLFVLIPLISLSYFFPVLVGVCIHKDWASWGFGEFTKISNAMGFHTLGTLMVIGGMFTFLGLFNSMILTSTRVFSSMSEDGFLPKCFSVLTPSHSAPKNAIIFCGVMYSILVLLGFNQLVVYDVFLYLIAIFLEAISLLVLRKTNNHNEIKFKIPFGITGLYFTVGIVCFIILLVAILQLACIITSVSTLIITFAFVFSGVPIYLYFRRYQV